MFLPRPSATSFPTALGVAAPIETEIVASETEAMFEHGKAVGAGSSQLERVTALATS
jgi:hypothetical protein